MQKRKSRTRKDEPSPQELFGEIARLIKSADSQPVRPKSASNISQKTRLAKLQKALSSGRSLDALEKVRKLIPDDGAGAQEVFVYGFACILETSSAGLSILFDRFNDDELGRIRSSLESIEATRTLTALHRLEKAFERAAGKGQAGVDAAETVTQLPDAQRIDRNSPTYVDEMQEKLLEFCEAHLQELAAG